MVDWVRLGADAEELATKALQSSKQVTGLLRPMSIRPYRGYVAHGVAYVRARVLEQPFLESAAEGLSLDAMLTANLMRWVVLDLPGVDVNVSMGEVSVTGRTNKDGFMTARLPVGDLEPGWHAVNYTAYDPQTGAPITSVGRVVRPDPAAKLAVITDIDDTILRTGMTEGLKSIQRTLLRDAHGRKPIAGMPSLYRGLARGQGGHAEATFFYVSASPWNLYDMLVQFLAIRGFPRGPLFLTDWGPTDRYLHRSGSMHKKHTIGRLMHAYPHTPFLLVGDTGQGDFDAYTDAARHFPGQVALIVLLPVGDKENEEQLRERAAALRDEEDIPVHVVATVLEAAQLTFDAGLCDDLTLEEVQTELGAIF